MTPATSRPGGRSAADPSVGIRAEIQNKRAFRGEVFPGRPKSASVDTRRSSPAHVHATKVAFLVNTARPPTAARSHAREFTHGFCRFSTTTKCTKVRLALLDSRASPLVRDRPPKGSRFHLSRPEATELIEPSTTRRSCSLPAASPTGKPAGHSIARLKPKLQPGHRSSEW
jgi:hypothetical protein